MLLSILISMPISILLSLPISILLLLPSSILLCGCMLQFRGYQNHLVAFPGACLFGSSLFLFPVVFVFCCFLVVCVWVLVLLFRSFRVSSRLAFGVFAASVSFAFWVYFPKCSDVLLLSTDFCNT